MSAFLLEFSARACKSIQAELVGEKNPLWDLLLSLQKLRITVIYCCARCIFFDSRVDSVFPTPALLMSKSRLTSRLPVT